MSPESPCILAIESSCDETSAAVVRGGTLLSNVVASQSVHEQYGGVVPELASRAHQQNIIPVVHQALSEAGISLEELNAVAYTQGPGLMGALLVGASFAKGLALSRGLPLIGVNHMQAHILAHFIEEPRPSFPFLCLTVSGGHTQIVRVNGPLDMEVLGQTQDDAVGEAFDKTAKLLGLPYPGGPLIDRYAQSGNPKAYTFPIPEMPGLNFSFSGIKTAFLYFLRDLPAEEKQERLVDICASIQFTLVEILLRKLRKAAQQTGLRHIAIAGGVSANSGLRQRLAEEAQKQGWQVYIPALAYCTDNAGMIAMAAHYHYQAGRFESLSSSPDARMPFVKA